ncbi:hypothetical protein G4228_013328 [Cervus hanglu yarkandensis]|nr:hypothetical protein G4228_013328 [Cervus hanglu yarkandensis]
MKLQAVMETLLQRQQRTQELEARQPPPPCEKRGLSNPKELQAVIDSNRREGGRQSFGGSLFAYSLAGAHSMLSSPKLPVSSLGLATSTNGSSITPAPKVKKEEDGAIPIMVPGCLPVSLAGHPVVATQAVAAQAAALEQLREKREYINGIVYTGVLFAQPPSTPPSAPSKGGGGSSRGGNSGTNSSSSSSAGSQAGPAGRSAPSTSTSNNSLP